MDKIIFAAEDKRDISVFAPLASVTGYAINDVHSTVWDNQVSLRLVAE